MAESHESRERLAGLDCLIHEPARLAIMTALSASEGADFLFLQSLTGLTRGNLSSHLSKLEDAGLVDVKKRFIGKKPNTYVSLTGKGLQAIDEHWKRLERLRKAAMDSGDPPSHRNDESSPGSVSGRSTR